jgi:hypothetical protein
MQSSHVDKPVPVADPQALDNASYGSYPKEMNLTAQHIGLVQIVVGKYKYKNIEIVDSMNKNKACLTRMQIEHALIHPRDNGPTRASKTYNTWKQENTLNWWGTFEDKVPFIFGPEHVNALSRNQYSHTLPGYLSNYLEYTKMKRIIPSPTQILREPINDEKTLSTWRLRDVYQGMKTNIPTTFVLRSKCSMLRQVPPPKHKKSQNI